MWCYSESKRIFFYLLTFNSFIQLLCCFALQVVADSIESTKKRTLMDAQISASLAKTSQPSVNPAHIGNKLNAKAAESNFLILL